MYLYEATLDLARLLMRVKTGTATDDSANRYSLLDTSREEPSDYFFRDYAGGGSIWIPNPSYPSSGPIGWARKITDFLGVDDFTYPKTYSFLWNSANPTTADILTGWDYYAAPIDWTYDELVASVNQALQGLGEEGGILQKDEIDVDTDVNEVYLTAYDLTAGVENIKRVKIITGYGRPNNETLHLSWDEDRANQQLLFDTNSEPRIADATIQMWYCAPHEEVTEDTDEIAPIINRNLLRWTAAMYAFESRQKDETLLAKENRAIAQSQMLRTMHPVTMKRDPHLNYEYDVQYGV